MKKQYRVKDTREFDTIIHHRKSVGSKSYVIYAKEKKEKQARIGIAVPKKLGNAVLRNKIKRQIRAILRPMPFYEGNHDLIIIVRKPYLDRSYEDNQKDLEKLLKHVKIKNDVKI